MMLCSVPATVASTELQSSSSCTSGSETQFDEEQKIQARRAPGSSAHSLASRKSNPDLWGHDYISRDGERSPDDEDSRECAAYLDEREARVLARIGYDLFSEVRTLLTSGQPVANAGLPALELHIAFLRDLITCSGVPLVEIPPVPDGYQFIACLTHDVDHPSIRRHEWDHTMFGFLYRAIIWFFAQVSFADECRFEICSRIGRRP